MADSGAQEGVGWLTFEVEDGPSWRNNNRTIYLPFPSAVIHILRNNSSDFTPTNIDADLDEFNQWRITLKANWFGQREFKWTGVGLTFEDAQNALVRFMAGWWFERDL